MIKSKWWVITLLVLGSLLLVSCGSKSLKDRLQGTWIEVDQFKRVQRVLVFKGNQISEYYTYPRPGAPTITVRGKQLWLQQELPFRLVDEDVTVDRMNRYGQTSPVRHITVLSEDGNTLDLREDIERRGMLHGYYERDRSK